MSRFDPLAGSQSAQHDNDDTIEEPDMMAYANKYQNTEKKISDFKQKLSRNDYNTGSNQKLRVAQHQKYKKIVL